MTRQEYNGYVNSVREFFAREGIDNLTAITPEGEEFAPEPYFSWSRCDCCGRPEGGDREDCNGWNPTTREICGPYAVCTDCVYFAEYGRLDDKTMQEISE